MLNRFSFYDFMGFLVPGMIGLWAGTTFFDQFLGIAFPLQPAGSLGESTLFVIASYFVGHVLQGFGNRLEDRAVRRWGGYPSQTLMRDSDSKYPKEFKRQIVLKAKEILSLPEDADVQERFNLIFTFLQQQGLDTMSQRFNGLYGFYRGLIITSWLGQVLFAVLAVKHLFTNWKLLLVDLTLVAGFEVAKRECWKRFTRFGRYFADAVYRGFYVYSHTRRTE